MPLSLGTTLGPYEIQAPLGAGGMGEVYTARDTRLDRTVAIRVLPEHVVSSHILLPRASCRSFDLGRFTGPGRVTRPGTVARPVRRLV